MISASSDSLQRVIDRYRWMTRACTAIVLWLSVVNASSRAEQIVVVVLDDSGSMQKTVSTGATRIDAAKASLGAVLEQLPHDTQFGILALNSRVKGSPWIVPLGSPDYQRWHDELSSVRAYGGTPLGQHMREAADELLKMRAKNPFAVYRLLVVTDGEATDAPILRAIMPDLLSRGLNLDVIGVGMSEDHSLARVAHSYRRAGDQQALTQALSEALAETFSDNQANQSDFDMLSGLPDDVAAELVNALSTVDNGPLDVSKSSGKNATGVGFGDANQPNGSPGTGPPFTQPPNNAPNQDGNAVESIGRAIFSTLSSLCCCGTSILIALFMIGLIRSAVKNNTRS